MSRMLHLAAASAFALSTAWVAASPAAAQDGNSEETAGSSEFDALKSCRTIADDAARLACFDNAMGVVVAAEESGDIRVVDREADQNTRRRLFGFSLPNLGLFGSDDDEEIEELATTITSVRQLRRNAWVFRTEEGAVWQIQSAPSRLRSIDIGDSVVFKKASLGSYFIRINGQLGVKGKRIE